MKEKDIILTEILGAAIRNVDMDTEKYRGRHIDWMEIYMEAAAHQVHTLIYPEIKIIHRNIGMEREIMDKWTKSVMSCGFQMLCDEIWVGEVLEILNTYKIQTIILKGMAINKWYPHPELRTMGDADILVHEKDMKKAAEILQGLGYKADKDKKTKHVEFHRQQYISIELHRLLADYNFIENSDLLNIDAWSAPMELDIGNTKALALSWEMQILHFCIHMASHISHGGIGLRQLCDMVVAVEKGYDKIDWNKVVDMSIKYGISHFVNPILQVCNKLFGMILPDIPDFKTDINNDKINFLIEDILSGGNFGRRDINRIATNALTRNLYGKGLQYNNKMLSTIRIIFPSREKMAERYKYFYINKNPLLLPVAWVHRIAFGIVRKDYSFDNKKALFKDDTLINSARDRNDLLEWLGLR
ncbi:hypothetical protein CLHUN_13720 [Ruminiclostridium hungatei]|uniref:Nucleotidyltransferase family protein n=1 Tax=Ruminiclostridium hungatei TaxID=48256 RepID=A0A1V4SLS1_RUMHU|nr:nucleotidyltransferase family protein [Ruminiclostridium hungatei]OPX44818.1 hypothetical protein CLHUN_13720 [Ruminiclostridium hungatei]